MQTIFYEISELEEIKTGTTYYFRLDKAQITVYKDQIMLIDLLNAGKRGATCKKTLISTNRGNISEMIQEYIKIIGLTLGEFLTEIKQGDYGNVDIEYFSDLNEYDIKAVRVHSPFFPISKEAAEYFNRLKGCSETAQNIIDRVSEKTKNGGTCNNDSVMVEFPEFLTMKEIETGLIRWKIKAVKFNSKVKKDKKYYIDFEYRGQGAKQEAGAKAAAKYFNEHNIKACYWAVTD